MNLKPELDVLARAILDRAKLKETPFTDVIDAFKSVRDYYLHTAKLKAKLPEEASEGSFASFQAQLEEVENGGAQVGSDRKRPRDRGA